MTTLSLKQYLPAPSLDRGTIAVAAGVLTAALLVALSWGVPPDPDAPQWHGNAGHVSLAQ